MLDVTRRFGLPAGATVAGLTLPAGRTAGRARPTQAATTGSPSPAGCMRWPGTCTAGTRSPCGSTRAAGARTLLDVNPYNFDQRSVPLPEPVAIKAGDVLRVTCTHDASLRPQVLPGVRRATWSGATAPPTGMCLGILIRD